MTRSSNKIDVYLEIGKKRTFASAIDWPGWCRSGEDEPSALQALVDYAPRYAHVLRMAQLDLQTPTEPSAFIVIERLKGNPTTDFGAPNVVPAHDTKPLNDTELLRYEQVLKACWSTFDAGTQAATGQALRKGPRGGGRDVEGILQHLLGGDAAYLSRVGWRPRKDDTGDLGEQLELTRQAILSALHAAISGEWPARGPRGGVRWPPRYFVRRVAWHVLDHAWELNDRVL